MKSCKVIQQKTHYYINLVSNNYKLNIIIIIKLLFACALQTHQKAHCRELETGQTEVLIRIFFFLKKVKFLYCCVQTWKREDQMVYEFPLVDCSRSLGPRMKMNLFRV